MGATSPLHVGESRPQMRLATENNTMQLDLSEIVMRDGMRVVLEVDKPTVEDPDLIFVEPITGQLEFTNGGDVVSIQGPIQTSVTLACGRCLVDTTVPLEFELEEHFPISEVTQPNRQPAQDEEFDPTISSVVYLEQGRPILDLDELLRQWLVSELPRRVVCSEECAGLCPLCGANRNLSPCGCEEVPVNRPLAALATLLDGK